MPQLNAVAALAGSITILGALASGASTLAHWDFNDVTLGAAAGAALPDSDSQTTWRVAATDKSGNGNDLTTWDSPWAGFAWLANSPSGDFSIKSTGSYPAAYTWSNMSHPAGADVEAALPARFTIEAVATVAADSASRTLVGRDGRYLSTGAPNNAALYFGVDGGDHPVFEFTDVSSNRVRLVASTTVLTEDGATWYHMAGVSDGSAVSLYLNHALIATTNRAMGALAKGMTNGTDWHAGGWTVARGLYAGGHTDRWQGMVDAVAISDAALSTNTFVLPKPAYSVPRLADVTNEVVYLFCYHVGGWPAGGASGVFVNWSTDGLSYYPLNNGHPAFVTPEFAGDDADDPATDVNMTRDPSIIYDAAAGLYRMVWTSALWTRSFGYAESPDLKHWTNTKLVQMWPNPSDTIKQTWAPEWFHIEETGEYMIIFSSAVNSNSLRLYYTKTTDFENFTSPVELYHDVAQSSVIDGFMAKVEADHYMMATAQQGTIWIVDGPTPYGPWAERASASMVTPREGPALIQINGVWHLYADYYTGVSDNVFRLSTSTDTTNWTDRSVLTLLPRNSDVSDFDGPPHHGTIFRAPRSTLGAYLQDPRDSITNLSSLVYRWSFNNPTGPASAGTVVTDTVSGATAIVRGTNAQFTGSALRLPGTTTGNAAADSMAAYVDLPNGIISALTNLTVEIWATPVSSKSWQRLFEFGRTAESGDGAPGEWTGAAGSAAPGSTAGSDDLFLTLSRGTDLNLQRCDMRLDGASISTTEVAMDSVAGRQYHFAVTFEDGVGFYGGSGGRLTLYRDGKWIAYRDVAFHLRQIEDVNNWLGRSQWSGDSNSNVDYDEVRIYSQALTWPEVFGHFLSGPNVAVDGAPTLRITSTGGGVLLNWPGNAAGFTPRQAAQLTFAPVWSTVTNAIQSTTNGLQVTLPALQDKAWFRLQK